MRWRGSAGRLVECCRTRVGHCRRWVLDRSVGLERPLPTRHGFDGLDDDAQLALYLCYEPISQENVQRRDLLPHTGRLYEQVSSLTSGGFDRTSPSLWPVRIPTPGDHVSKSKPGVGSSADSCGQRLCPLLVVAQRLPGRRGSANPLLR